MRRNFFVSIVSALVLALIVSCSSSNYVKVRQYAVSGDIATPMDARNFDVFILATGDVCGEVNREELNDDVIGLSTLAGLVQAVRKFNENTIVVDTGNFLYGTRFASGNSTSDLKNGAAMVDLARRIGYNAMNVGRHDLLYGRGALTDNVNAAARFANEKESEVFYVSQNIGNGINKFKIFNFSGFKIGVIGLTTPDVAFEVRRNLSGAYDPEINYEEFQRDINSLNRVVDYVVLLSNLRSGDELIPRFTNIETVISKLKGIDLVINNDGDVGSAVPKKIKDKIEKEVMMVCPGSSLESVGLIQFQVEAGIPVGEPVYTLISGKEIRRPDSSNALTQLNVVRKPENENVSDYIHTLQDKIDLSEGAPFAYLPYEFLADRQQLGSMQTDIGFIIADSLARATEAQVAVFPSIIVKKSLPSGEITKQDVFRSVPSLDHVIRVSMTGQELYDAIEYAYGGLPAAMGRYPQTNLIIDYNPAMEEGNRVVSIALQNGEKIERNQVAYTVATLDSVLSGLYDYNRYFKDRNRFTVPNPITRGYREVWEVFSDYLAQQYPVETSV